MATPTTGSERDRLTSTEFTQQTMFSDLSQQRWLIGAGIGLGAFALIKMLQRPQDQEKAARRLVRDWRKVDDVGDARDLLGTNVPVILRPILLTILEEVERQVQHGFRRLERNIDRL